MAEGDTFRSRWIAQPVIALFPGVDQTRPELTIEVRCGEEPMTIRVVEGRVSVLTGPPDATVELLARRIDAAEARTRGLAVTGDPELLRRLRPQAPRARSTSAEPSPMSGS